MNDTLILFVPEKTQLEEDPKLALDDCCGYCEKYREGAITPQKRMEIDTWRQVVHNSNNNQYGNMKKSITIPINFRYSPPGYPDEPGFRKIKVTGDLKKDLRKLNLELPRQHAGGKSGKSVNFFRLTSDLASMSMDYDSERRHVTSVNAEELPSTWKQNRSDRVGGATSPSSPRIKSGRGYRVVGTVYNKKDIQRGNVPPTKQKLNRNDTKISHFNSQDSSKDSNYSTTDGAPGANGKNEYRTCSNDLLNVISIDDFRMRHKRYQKPIREDSRGSLVDGNQTVAESRAKGQGQGDPSSSVATGGNKSNSTGQRGRLQSDSARRIMSPTESGYDYQLGEMYYYDDYGPNETVNKAFNSILCGDNAATNSHAHRGLFKYESRSKELQGRPKESKRFRRLNRTLHDWIENEIVIPHQNSRGWYLSSSGSYHVSQSPTTTQSQSRSMLRSEGQGDQASGAFLGMLMEIDENTESNTKYQQ